VIILLIAVLIFIPMLLEARVSRMHELTLRAHGAIEPQDDVMRVMQVAYPSAFAVMLVEGALGRVQGDRWVIAGLVLFAAAKVLKYWAIATLGSRWTFRVLVPPGSRRTVLGPYRWVAHPNYIAVAGELTAVALAAHAPISGPLATLAFVLLMRRRVVVEERALAEPGRRAPA
jgi:methyltransferase